MLTGSVLVARCKLAIMSHGCFSYLNGHFEIVDRFASNNVMYCV